MNNRARTKGRMAIYVMAGFYLLYLAYSMFKNLSASAGNEIVLVFAAMVFFAIVGLAMIIFGTWRSYQLLKKEQSSQKDLDDQQENDQ